MKSITVYFEDEEFETLKEAKKKLSWHNFIIDLFNLQDIKSKEKEVKT